MNVVIDIECNESLTKIHCLCYNNLDSGISGAITLYDDMRSFLNVDDLNIIGHNFVKFDKKVLENVLSIKLKARIIDTLGLSWYMFFERKRHGLEKWGEDLGIEKPKIADWNNLSLEEYMHRCEEDVKINTLLWKKEYSYLYTLYEGDTNAIRRICNYLSYKLDCVAEQEQIGIRLNIEQCNSTLSALEAEETLKIEEIEKAMPKVAVKKTNVYNDAAKDEFGNIFTMGDLFFQDVVEKGAPIEDEIKLEKIKSWKEPNADSPKQIKDWLYSLGWVPEHIKFNRNKETGEIKQVPQIGAKEGQGELCNSVKKLFDKEPKLAVLDGLGVISHRIGILKGFLRDQKEGRLYPGMMGFTNTLRLQHSVIVNLPGIDKRYGREIRECLIADEGMLLVNSDLSNIEDRTKRHYIYKYDPQYVEDMNVSGYDAHLEIALLANYMTKEDVEFYKQFETRKKEKASYKASKSEIELYEKLKGIRWKAKQTNFAATYKVGWATLCRNYNLKKKESQKLLKVFWDRNKAIIDVEESLTVKTIGEKKWVYNPISRFWYSLRNEKDRFSTLNQGTAVYVFDLWVTEVRKYGVEIGMQMHDEINFNIYPGRREETDGILQNSIQKVNDKLKLNIQVGCSMETGTSYADVH